MAQNDYAKVAAGRRGASLGAAEYAGAVASYSGYPKEKKMGWFKKTIKNWLNDETELYPAKQTNMSVQDSYSIESQGINFNIHKASGGFIVETRNYDIKTDRRDKKLYVITEDVDLGVEIGKIITMECLRR